MCWTSRRRRSSRLAPFVVVALVTVAGAGCDASSSVSTTDGTVAVVADGDTVVLGDGRRIRLVQIDAPEAEDECFGREATALLRRLTPRGTTVALERDPALDDVDAYGRPLRYVVVGGTNVNLELVRLGAAVPYFFRGDRGRYADELLAVAHEARAAGLGLWGACPGARLDPARGAVTGSR
jgi:micrococcal nuclease